jgi:F0F1-type ATP synthase membrane subunit c/vacuolar-type H+-ATPase subunit K
VILRSGEVESKRGRTVEASLGFIGAGAGVGMGLSWCGAARAEPSAGACSGVARARRTRGGVILPTFLRLLSTQTCESCHMACVRFLPYT